VARQALIEACHLLDRGKATEEIVDVLTDFAREVAPADATLREWDGLRRRLELGMRGIRRRPWYAAAAIRRRLRHEISLRRWSRTGVWEATRPMRRATKR
jgi:hypothetical protein